MVHCSGMAKFEQAGPLFRMPTRETAAADPGCPERARVSARISLLSAPPLARPAAMRCDAMRCAAGQAAARPAAVRSSAPAPTTSSRLSPPLPASRPACLRRRAWGVDFRPGTQELVPALWLTGDGAPKQNHPVEPQPSGIRAAAGQQQGSRACGALFRGRVLYLSAAACWFLLQTTGHIFSLPIPLALASCLVRQNENARCEPWTS